MRYVNCLIFSYVGAECSFSVPDISIPTQR